MLRLSTLAILVFLISFNSYNIYAQAESAEIIDLQGEQIYSQGIEDLQWIWGEVIEINRQEKRIKVRFLDYETDGQKDADFLIDEASEFANVTSLAEIRLKDSAGIDYYVNENGKNIIKSISIESLNIPSKE